MKQFLISFIIFLVNITFAYNQSYQPNYPHISSGKVEIQYTIVIGSMQETTNADRLLSGAVEKGFSGQIIPFNKSNKLLNRVCIGRTNNRSEANKLLREVKTKLKISNAWILEVPKITPLTDAEKQEIVKQNIENEKKSLIEEKEKLEAQKKHEQEVLKKLKDEEQKRLEDLRKADEDQLEELRKAVQEKINLEKQKLEAEKLAELKRIEDERIAEQEKLNAEKNRLEAEKLAELKRIEDERIAEQERLNEEKKRLEAEKQAELQRIEDERIAEQERLNAEKKRLEAENMKTESKATTTQFQTIDREFDKDSTSVMAINDFNPFNEDQKKEFIEKYKVFIENLRNYDYAKANLFIHPDYHLFVIYNDAYKTLVREFPTFEKYFAVFSVFTNKGSSYDFSLDVERYFKENIRYGDFPVYDCKLGKFNKSGMIATNIPGTTFKFSKIVLDYFQSINQDIMSEQKNRIQELDKLICISIISTDALFIEGMYFGCINGKWYLLVMDLRNKCK